MPVLLNSDFFVCREDFSCGFAQLIDLMDTCPGHGKDGDENGAPDIGDMITMCVRDLLDESVGAQQAELPADARGTLLALPDGFGLAIQDRPQISIAEAVD